MKTHLSVSALMKTQLPTAACRPCGLLLMDLSRLSSHPLSPLQAPDPLLFGPFYNMSFLFTVPCILLHLGNPWHLSSWAHTHLSERLFLCVKCPNYTCSKHPWSSPWQHLPFIQFYMSCGITQWLSTRIYSPYRLQAPWGQAPCLFLRTALSPTFTTIISQMD